MIPRAARPTDAEVECPHALWSRLRAESPLHEIGDAGYALVTRHANVCAVARDPATFSSNLVAVLLASQAGVPQVLDVRAQGPEQADALALADPPVHTRQRRLLNPAFNVRRIAILEPAIRTLGNQLIDAFSGDGRVEWMESFAVPLPVTVIADLLDMPRADVPQIKLWSDAAIQLLSGVNTPESLLECHRHIVDLQRYLVAHLERHGERRDDSVMGAIAAAIAATPPFLSHAEALNVLVTLVTAGNETTTSAIGSVTRLVLEHPAERAALQRDRARIPAFIEECLRLESPFHGHFRLTKADSAIGGVAVPEQTRLMLGWGAANRDPAVFPDPDALAPGRPNLKDHVAFGHGIHFCLGAPLARLETRVALELLLDRLPGARIAPGHTPRHVPSLFVRKLAALPLEF